MVMSRDTFNRFMETVHLLKSTANATEAVVALGRLGRLHQLAGSRQKDFKAHNVLIKDTLRQPFDGIGKPEPLKENLSGFCSRRINVTHPLVYCVDGDSLAVIACRYRYQ